jgi:Fic family protein
LPALTRAGMAHLYFVTIHPFEDGNGRIARAVGDLFLARADGSPQRFYSMSAQIQQERNAYYDVLEKSQKGTLDITLWIEWYLNCLRRAINASDKLLETILAKDRFWKLHKRCQCSASPLLVISEVLLFPELVMAPLAMSNSTLPEPLRPSVWLHSVCARPFLRWMSLT